MTQLFTDKFKQLERQIKNRYHLRRDESAINFLLQRPEYQQYYIDLDYCRELRNFLSHNPEIKNSIQPTQGLIYFLDEMIKQVINPPLAEKHAITKEDIISAKPNDYVLPFMQEMKLHSYSHIPILENDIVIGVFSENTILSYLLHDEMICIDNTTKFSDDNLMKYLPLAAHTSETFKFVNQSILLEDANSIFQDALQKGERIGLVFLTETGDEKEPITGILTAWDVAGAKTFANK